MNLVTETQQQFYADTNGNLHVTKDRALRNSLKIEFEKILRNELKGTPETLSEGDVWTFKRYLLNPETRKAVKEAIRKYENLYERDEQQLGT